MNINKDQILIKKEYTSSEESHSINSNPENDLTNPKIKTEQSSNLTGQYIKNFSSSESNKDSLVTPKSIHNLNLLFEPVVQQSNGVKRANTNM
jgi:hypothetical protein